MKINSSFYDYYDNAVEYDNVDNSLHYNRFTSIVRLSEIKSQLPEKLTVSVDRNYRNRYPDPSFELMLMGFCGRLYPVVNVINTDNNPFNMWIYDQFDLRKREREGLFSVHGYGFKFAGRPLDGKEFLAHKGESVEPDFFLEIKAPAFLIRKQPFTTQGYHRSLEVVVNPMLRDYSFFRVMDAFTAFQELSMYLGNVLVTHDKPDTIGDDDRIKQHGFDFKWSFRKKSGE